MGYVRNLGSETIQNPRSWKIFIYFSHYFNEIGNNNEKKRKKYFPVSGFWTVQKPKFITYPINFI